MPPGRLRSLDPRAWPEGRPPAGLVLALALGLFAVPIAVDLITSPKLRPFGYATSDTFYYLTIGRNLARLGRASFDGQYPTDGFHPLWQLVVAGLYWLSEALHAARYFVLEVIVFSAVLIGVAVYFLGRAMQSAQGRLTPLFMLLPTGVYSLLVAPAWLREAGRLASHNSAEGPMPVYGTLWSYANGMETPLAICVFGLVAWMFCQRPIHTRATSAWFGIALGVLVLSRLDYVFISASICAGVCVSGWAHAEKRPAVIRIGASAAGLVVGFMGLNWLRVGHLFPVSAVMKSSFPRPTPEHVEGLASIWSDWSQGIDLARFHREVGIVVPMVTAFGFLVFAFEARSVARGALRFRADLSLFERFLALAAPGVLALSLYDFLFVAWWGIGHWYFGVPTLFVSLVAVSLLSRIRLEARHPVAQFVVLAAGIALLSIAFFAKMHVEPRYHEAYSRFYWDEAPRVLERVHQPFELMEFDDGIVSYSLDVPAMSGLGLALDPEAHAVHGGPAFLSLAVDRGYDVVTTLVYQPHPIVGGRRADAEARRWVTSMGEGEPTDFNLAVLYSSETFTLVRLRKR